MTTDKNTDTDEVSITYGLTFGPLVDTSPSSGLWTENKGVMSRVTKAESDPEYIQRWLKCPRPLPPKRGEYLDNMILKACVREGVPSRNRVFVWNILTSGCSMDEAAASFQSALSQTFKWKNLDNFAPRYVPHFGTCHQLQAHLRSAFALTDCGVDELNIILCLLAEYNADVTFAPTLPAVLAALLTELPAPQVFLAGKYLIANSRKEFSDTSKIHFLKLTKTEHYNSLGAVASLLQNRLPSVVLTFVQLKVDMLALLHELFSGLFCTTFPLPFIHRLVDTLLNEGYKVLYRYCLSLFSKLQFSIAKCKTSSTLVSLFRSRNMWQPDDLFAIFSDAFTFSLSRNEVNTLELKVEKEQAASGGLTRETELALFGELPPTLRNRPRIVGDSDILKTPQEWESLFMWAQHEGSSLMGQLALVFRTQDQGWSLQSMYRRCSELQDHFDACIMLVEVEIAIRMVSPENKEVADEPDRSVVKTGQKLVIGAHLSEFPAASRNYTGSSRTFFFQLSPIETIFPASGVNDYFLLCDHESLCIGGGPKGCALRLRDDLQVAWSSPCETFSGLESKSLTGRDTAVEDAFFEVLQLELFGAELLHKSASGKRR